MKSNFHNNTNRKDGLQPHCISCIKQYYIEDREKTKKYCLDKGVPIKGSYSEN